MTVTNDQTVWDHLVAHGLPLAGVAVQPDTLNSDALERFVSQAIAELNNKDSMQNEDIDRKRESLSALLLALRESFPSVFAQFAQELPVILEIVPSEISGRLIKLKRISEKKAERLSLNVIDETLVKRFVRLLSDRLPGDWIIIGGTVLPLVGIDYRTTLDIDVAGPDPQTAAQTIGLMNLAEELGLPVEAINQAGAFFLYRMTDWQQHLVVVCRGSAGRVLRPDATLFIRLKLGRLSETDLADCLAFVDYCRSGSEPIDKPSLLQAISDMRSQDSNPSRIARLRVLEEKLQD